MATKLNVIRKLLFSCQKTLFSKIIKNAGRPQFIQKSRLIKQQTPLTKRPWLEFSNRQSQLSKLTKIGNAPGLLLGFGLVYLQNNDLEHENFIGSLHNKFFIREAVDNFLNHQSEDEAELSEQSMSSVECKSTTSFQSEDNKENSDEMQKFFKDSSFLEEVTKENVSKTDNEKQSGSENDWSLLDDIVNSLCEETQSLLTDVRRDYEVVSHVSSAQQETNKNDKGDNSLINSNFRQIQSFNLSSDMCHDTISFKPMEEEFWSLLNYFLENDPDFILKDQGL
ncbi:DgyrCDS6123 [Dimorphilus gyrociliatus]|uniref:DgyrCDS6123 n=1 Tax=Dimorphilus gyrociliatus TaxID=2664684 RepID=A0A7I8VNN1_9ANNE|nr:DgyrCDS6123 [Dimorphilus gyrociliatus]